jgi:uncharacterized protein
LGGVLLNTILVAIGSLIGLRLGDRFPQRIQQSVMGGLGLVVLVIALGNANRSGNIIIPLISVVVGVIIGELLRLDLALERLGDWIRVKAMRGNTDSDDDQARARFVFCIGPLAVVGSLQDGMGLAVGFQQIAIKSILDFFGAIAFAATLGHGVFFSTITIIVVQGGFSLFGMLVGEVMTAPMINEMTAAGGIILIALALILLDIKHLRVANFLPALVIAPLIVVIAGALGINIYPL